jgi:hypothetical protein
VPRCQATLKTLDIFSRIEIESIRMSRPVDAVLTLARSDRAVTPHLADRRRGSDLRRDS